MRNYPNKGELVVAFVRWRAHSGGKFRLNFLSFCRAVQFLCAVFHPPRYRRVLL